MSVTPQDNFGEAPAIEPATPGSYGEAPSGFRLPAATSVGAVGSRSPTSTARSTTTGRSASRCSGGTSGRAGLAAGEPRPPWSSCASGAAPGPPAAAGSGSTTSRSCCPTGRRWAASCAHLGRVGVRAGAGDHLVSEALYLTDPDGLGIEVYADRPRETWRRDGRELVMATDPLDVARPRRRRPGARPGPACRPARRSGTCTCTSATSSAPRASTPRRSASTAWSGAIPARSSSPPAATTTTSAPTPGPARSAAAAEADEAQLLEWTLELPDAESVRSAAASLVGAGFAAEIAPEGTAARTRDPWGTPLALVARAGRRP